LREAEDTRVNKNLSNGYFAVTRLTGEAGKQCSKIKTKAMEFLEIKNKIIEEVNSALDKVEKADVFANAIISSDKIFVAGAGRSKLIIEAFAQRLGHLGLKAYVVGEVIQPPASKGDFLIVASGSGKSVFPLSIAKKAKEIGMKVALITAEKKSPIAEISDLVICIPAGSKFCSCEEMASFQPLGSLFEQCLLIFCDAVIIIIQKAKKISTQILRKNHANLE
jgi:6-phospho-3-hexuloisomerase